MVDIVDLPRGTARYKIGGIPTNAVVPVWYKNKTVLLWGSSGHDRMRCGPRGLASWGKVSWHEHNSG